MSDEDKKKYKMPHGWYKLRKNGNKWMYEQNCLIFDTNNYRRHHGKRSIRNVQICMALNQAHINLRKKGIIIYE